MGLVQKTEEQHQAEEHSVVFERTAGYRRTFILCKTDWQNILGWDLFARVLFANKQTFCRPDGTLVSLQRFRYSSRRNSNSCLGAENTPVAWTSWRPGLGFSQSSRSNNFPVLSSTRRPKSLRTELVAEAVAFLANNVQLASKAFFFANTNIFWNKTKFFVKRSKLFDKKIVTPVACSDAGHRKITKYMLERWMLIFRRLLRFVVGPR